MAPEVFRHETYNETVDVYSYGMIFFYLLDGRPPWPSLAVRLSRIVLVFLVIFLHRLIPFHVYFTLCVCIGIGCRQASVGYGRPTNHTT
jgi:serine/threonine protein kinase